MSDYVMVRYPDAVLVPEVEMDLLHMFGRYGVVYGLTPHNHGEQRYHAYLVVNLVRRTIDFYATAEAQAIAQMRQLELIWQTMDAAFAADAEATFEEEDAEAKMERELDDLANKQLN